MKPNIQSRILTNFSADYSYAQATILSSNNN